jgi:predicted patatin/cPLA2 family phospholipase
MENIKSVVFAGGGGRCLWQVGFWDTVSPVIKLKPETVAGVSAGAAMALMAITGRSEAALKSIKSATSLNKKNFYPENIFKKDPLFPHYNIYRNTILEIIDNKTLKNIKKGPEIRTLIAHPPFYLGPRSGTFTGLMSYVIEKAVKQPVHPRLASKLGFTYSVVNLNDCETAEEMAHLILCSSCTPPFVPIMKLCGKTALDGGIIDNVPVKALGDDINRGDTLILMSKTYKEGRIPQTKGRIYVEPSKTPEIFKWDYTSPHMLQKAYDEGCRDGELFLQKTK